jgi:hypothetical protein
MKGNKSHHKGETIMAVQLTIDYEQVVQLVEQLTEEQQQALAAQILARQAPQQPLTAEEKMQILRAARVHTPANQSVDMSDRREDWYGDDGR